MNFKTGKFHNFPIPFGHSKRLYKIIAQNRAQTKQISNFSQVIQMNPKSIPKLIPTQNHSRNPMGMSKSPKSYSIIMLWVLANQFNKIPILTKLHISITNQSIYPKLIPKYHSHAKTYKMNSGTHFWIQAKISRNYKLLQIA